ncbi:dynein heavy chain 12, axonemal [Copidosoma floridanum]|uniref:dynein heavy chain 12, axonemal n=1 Tax=Copidosoma floridanum TaxID=29053 RepID=UPI0006C9E1BE|nr:dynein heavy chain 12, axonemal [Copidosoma floridanum]
MLNSVPPGLRHKYRAILEDQMSEVKERYLEVMHRICLTCVLSLEGAGDWVPDPPYKLDGRTENYPNFLRNRRSFASRYHLSHKVPRAIVTRAARKLPPLIVDFSKHRQLGYLDFHEFAEQVKAELDRGALTIAVSYHSDVARLVGQYTRACQAAPGLARCCGGLLALQIMDRMTATVENLLTAMSQPRHSAPLLVLTLKCENNDLFVSPLLREVYATFHSFLDAIGHSARQLPTVESLVRLRRSEAQGAARLPDWYLSECHEKLDGVLDAAFAPVVGYVEGVRDKFRMVYDPEMQRRQVARIVEGEDFDACLEKLDEFNRSVADVHGMTKNEYYPNCKLHQENAKNGLKLYADQVREVIINELVVRHKNFNIDVCSEYEAIKNRALDIPEETKELLELGRYMLHVQMVKLNELHDRVTESLRMLSSLFEMTSLAKDHVKLNNATFNWLQNIKPVLEKNSALYEQKKFELEDRLQRKMYELNKRVEDTFPRLLLIDAMDDANRVGEYIEFMRKFARDLDRMSTDVDWINREQDLFGFPKSSYPRIEELQEQAIMPFYTLIVRAHQWQRHLAVWLDGPFEFMDSGFVEAKTTEYFQDFSKMSKTFKTRIKMQLAMNCPYAFSGSVDDPDYHQQPAPMKLCHQLLENVKWFKHYVPLVMCFCNPALNQRHWDEMSQIAGFDLTPNAGTTLRKIVGMNLMDQIDLYEQVSVGATKELGLKELLERLETEWKDVYFTTMPFKDTKVNILTQLDDIQALLEEQIVKVQAMRGSAFVKPIAAEVRDFYELILRIQMTLDEWAKVQVQWMYLLPIFSSKDIVAQLPEEGILFGEVDGTFRKAMQSVFREPSVRVTAGSAGLYEAMKESNEIMERVNDGVTNYLEKKRLFFPRFFFLSNDDMLEILSETKDPLRVQPHLKKCFEGIAKLGFDQKLNIYSMVSDDKEEINFVETISTEAARGCVERWLLQVEEQMVISVRQEVLLSYRDYEVNRRVDWVRMWPGMVVLCVSQIYWSIQVQGALMTHMESTIKTLYQTLRKQIIDVVNLVKGQLSKQNRTTLNALITIDVHAQDVVKSLMDKKITSETDFEWLAQLRYYWEDDVIVRIINASVPFAYEYLGNCPRLVITPLTDRCYRTLIGAYYLHLNGAPEGPAGTGKTETTKDLARALAVQCVVFNCSEGLDYKNMGKFFKGLASCGAWACFDEFNRIELEVLSVVAQQILCIVQAVRAKLETFIFEGTELKLNPAVYVCITMNPGYAGRSELPDNLKVLFRTVSMMVPSYQLIGEITLYSYGFVDARALAEKIVYTYKLCSEQLSSQSHYDYGMRAVKTVLVAAGNLKLKYSNENESILLLRSIIDVNLPKFLAHDVPLFQGIISDLFPGVELPTPNYDVLLRAIDVVAKKRNLQTTDGFLLKIIQTYEMMLVRHGFMLVGDPCGGKTTVLHTLADALTLMHEWEDENGAVTRYVVINPKSITMGQLYGQFDPVSSEWTDGVCAVAFRRFCSEESADRKWLIFDGPVDAVWIENLNTVLDDNKKLCLTSGEVMQMTNVMSMIFEVMDLTQASPATVSRCGMIYIEPHVLGWRPTVTSWVNSANPAWRENHEETINTLIDLYFDICLEFTKRKCTMTLTSGQINQITSTLSLIDMFMDDAVEENADGTDFNQYIDFWLQAAFLLALVWGIGGTLDVESREKYNDFITTIWRNENPNHPLPEEFRETISLPSDGLIHDNYFVFKGKGMWKFFFDVVKAEPIVETQSISQMLIPTMDTVKYQHIFRRHIKYKKKFLLFGKTGTGKSFYIQDLMINKLSGEEFLSNFITFTARTTAAQTQDLVISKLFKRRKGHYGPMANTQCVCFIDDVNMPAKEIYGAQPAIELLRQYFDHEHWYDLKEPEVVKIYDIMFVCAMAPPGGSRQELYARFLRHFNLYEISEFSNDSIFRIFTNVALFGLKRRGFTTSDVNTTVNSIVNATTVIFEGARAELRPTPAKSHYLFNLRDFSRVITGCTMIRKESAETKDKFIRLWTHEILRVFGDRLIDATDNVWLFGRIREAVEKTFREPFDNLFSDLPRYDEKLTEESLQHLIFGNFMDPEALAEDRKYEEIASIEEYKKVSLLCLEEYNSTHKNKMDIVMFRYALEHLARICRTLAIPGGSLLMVGVGGSGRQSLTNLAATMTGSGLFQPEIGSSYGTNEWRDDIKKVLKIAGSGKDTVFLFTEAQIKDESYLSDIDGLLNSGEVPNLFNVEEKQEVVEMTRLAAQGGNRNLDISVLSILRFFVNRCKEKLHVMLCFSPIGESFRTRLRMYPSFVNCCTIDWFQIWPEEALEQVALRSTTHIDVAEEVKTNAVIACKYFHNCAKEMSDRFYRTLGRKTYVTSAAFLDLIRAFGVLIKEKQEEVSLARDRYIGGLEKLEFAAEQVTKMQMTLTSLQPQLKKSAKLTMETMKKIESENLSVEQTTKIVKKEEDAANKQAEVAGALKAECEADLAEALPILDEAIAALNTLKPADITLVKSMKNPPEGVKLVMAAVCIMMSVQPDRLTDPTTGRKVLDYWGPSKRILSDLKFLDYLRDYDKDNINPSIMQTIEKVYLKDANFEPSKVAKASQAAEGLCKWVRALVLYDRVIKIVKPKQAKLAEAEQMFEDTMNLLNKKRQMLADLNAKLAALNAQLARTIETKIDLENQVILCSNKLIRAEKLISGLGGEKNRWIECAANLQRAYDCLPGDVLISCGMIAYLGPYTSAYRLESLVKWTEYVGQLQIPRSEDYSFVGVLGSEIKINSWNIYGLPRDSFSTENAIIMDNTKRCSLFIDPQSQANKWIRSMEKANALEIVKLTDTNYMNIVEQCIEYGKPVLIENVGEELDAPLDPILAKNIYKVAGTWYITLGEKSLEYSLDFRLYVTTKLRNPHYLPEVFNKVTLINFALTIEGLEDQLLGIVVAKERPDLQEKREYLIVEGAANKKALKQVEDNILRTLSTAGASILEDEEAIEILDSSKTLSIDIQRKQVTAKDTELKIEAFRQRYQPIAKHSAALYYTITDLPNIDPMYQYSLAWFINLYVMSIETANKSNVLEKRLAFLRETFTYNLYQNVCRSLFEKDKVLYSFILCTTIMQANGLVSRDEMAFFLTGGLVLPLASARPNPAPAWLSDKSWDEIRRSANLETFARLPGEFDPTAWKPFYDAVNPEDASLPEPWESRLDDFQKLVVMRMLRPDKVIPKVVQFVRKSMDARYVTPPAFDIARSYADSNCLVPLIFILSPGSDPMGALTKFAEQSDYLSRFFSISLGQGQGPIARGLIERAQEDGLWVCLNNVHLAVSWMSELEKICEGLDFANTSRNFRLWLTSYPSDKFPIAVLQNGVKMTNEPPSGLRQNLARSYASEPVKDLEFFTGCPGKERAFTRLLYGLCFFHAVVQERRNYGPQGWNIPYGFNESDFQISAQQLQIFINEYDEVPFKAILYLTGECNYGGRVTDDRDRRCLTTILLDFYNAEVVNNPDYVFLAGAGREYSLPKKCEYEDYIRQIELIPSYPPPEVLGLNMNAGITRDLDISKNFFDSLASMQGGVSVGDAAKQDELLLSIKADIYERLPELFDIEEAQRRHPASYSESMNTVLIQEMERYNVLLKEVRGSLAMLERAVRGMIVMTPDLETMSAYILSGKIPPSWRRASAYPSLKPLASFVNDFLDRLAFFQKWMDQGKPPTFWISGFSFVHAFLTGATQNYARKYKISIDLVDFDFQVLPRHESKQGPEDGVYVYGMYLTGARWDVGKMKLGEARAKVLHDAMPLVWLKPSKRANIKDRGRYLCPLYITSERFGTLKTTGHSTNYVLSILLDTEVPAAHWVKRGVALLCQLDD